MNADHNETVSENGFVSASRSGNALIFLVGPDCRLLRPTRRYAWAGSATTKQSIGIKHLKPRTDFAGEHADAVHGVVVLEESGLVHDQQVAVAADMLPVFLICAST
jgi:hypothetical protein